MKLKRKNMLEDEYQKYLEIGEIDYSQNWLELFTSSVVQDLFTIMDSSSDNQDKSDIVQEELGPYGFEPVGLGTNVYAVSNPAYPGVVFKIALDTCGLADNFNDATLCDLVNEYLGKNRYTKVLARHPSGIVTVQERKVLVRSQDRLDQFRESILKTLDKLSSEFLIIDLSPTHYHYNYGIDRDGDWCFIDASDLYPLAKLKKPITCKMVLGSGDRVHEMVVCGGNLVYNEDYSQVICEKCGRSYIPSDIRPKEKGERSMNVMTDGLDLEEIDAMIDEEMAEVLRNLRIEANSSQADAVEEDMKRRLDAKYGRIDTSDDGFEPDDDEDEEEEEPQVEVKQTTQTTVKREVTTTVLTPKPIPPKDPDQYIDTDHARKAAVVNPTYQQIAKKNIPEATPVPAPTAPRKSAFVVPPTTELGLKKPPVEEDPEEVEEPKVQQPTYEEIRKVVTPIDYTEEVEDDDEEDEDDVQFVPNISGMFRRRPYTEPPLPFKYEISDDGIVIDLADTGITSVEEFNDCYKEYGLPIFVKVDGNSYLAIEAAEFQDSLSRAVSYALQDVEIINNHPILGSSDDDDDEEEDDEE